MFVALKRDQYIYRSNAKVKMKNNHFFVRPFLVRKTIEPIMRDIPSASRKRIFSSSRGDSADACYSRNQ